MSKNMSPEKIAEILAELKAAEPVLPAGLKAKQTELYEARDGFKTWLDGVKKGGAEKWDGVSLTCTNEDYIKRETDLATKTAEFTSAVRPFMAQWELDKEAKMLETLGQPQRNFKFGDDDKSRQSSTKSLYQHLAENEDFKALLEQGIPSNQGFNKRIKLENVKSFGEFKTVFDAGTGYPMPQNRGPEVVPFAHRRPVVADFINSTPWNEQYYVFMENVTWTNNAAPVAESATKPESALAYVQRTVKLEVIAHTIPVTKQALRFGPDLESEIRTQMQDMLGLVEESQLLNGTGSTPQLTGITTRSGLQTYARNGATENNLDAIFQMFQNIRFVGFSSPSVVFLNPANFTPIALLKDSMGRYIYSDPAAPSLGTVWGVPYVQTPVVTLGTGITGDFAMWARILRSGVVEIEIGYVNDQFLKNQLTMRAEEFIALQVRRPAAFGTITNLA